MADNSGGEAGSTGGPSMDTMIKMSEPASSVAVGGAKEEGEPKVITMDAVSVPDESQVSNEIKAMLDNLHTDPYSEDEAELRFLHFKPTCFIITGKPGVGKSTLARRFAQEWKCELINSTELLLQNMELQTEMGQRCVEILTRGEAVPEDLVLKIIQEKIDSPEVAHHGYVLDDFPCMSEATMSIKDQVELIKSWKLKPDFIINLKVIWDGRLQFLNACCMACLEGHNHIRCVACKQPWDGRTLVVGSMYTYDIFAAVPCCQKRLTCKCCHRAVIDITKGLDYYSQYSHMIICPYCKANDYHFIRSLLETFLTAEEIARPRGPICQ